MNPELTGTPRYDKSIKIEELQTLLTQACILAADIQKQGPDLPEIQRSIRVNGKVVCIIACIVPDLHAAQSKERR